jgi:hypothetical protein
MRCFSRALLVAPLAAALALAAAGCGGSKSPTSTTGGSGPSFASITADAYKFSQCMRTHGVPGFPDPKIINNGHSQGVGIRVTPAETKTPAFSGAQKACRGIMPAGPTQQQQAGEQRAHQVALLAFARCMRSKGFHSFPDPNSQGDIDPNELSSAGVDVTAPAFRTDALACAGVTHGVLTAGQVAQALNHLSDGTQQAGGG